MRILLFIVPLKLILAQDSLFWFDMSSIRDPIPKSPIILDNIYGTSQIKVLDSLKNIRTTTRNGFRIQLYESSSSQEAKNLLIKYKKRMSDSLYLKFEAPLYKVLYGNFSNRFEAENTKRELRQKGYKNIWIVRSRIEQKYATELID